MCFFCFIVGHLRCFDYFFLVILLVDVCDSFFLYFTVVILGCAEEVSFWEGLIFSTKLNFLSGIQTGKLLLDSGFFDCYISRGLIYN